MYIERSLGSVLGRALSQFPAVKVLLLSYLGREKEAFALITQLLGRKSETWEGLRTDPAFLRSVHAVLLGRAGKIEEAEQNIALAIQNDRGLSHFHHAEYNIASAYALVFLRKY
jgi:hypothetical protein